MSYTPPPRAPLSERLTLSVSDVASLLGCSRNFVYGLMHAGDLPHIKVGSRTFIRRADLDDFVASQGAT